MAAVVAGFERAFNVTASRTIVVDESPVSR
jgi:hypothetical protein